MKEQNQLHRVFDFTTGEQLDESIVAERELAARETLEQGQSLEALVAMPGWKLVEDFCLSNIEAAKEKLLDAKTDMDTIRRLQSLAAAFSNLLGAVDHLIRDSQDIRAEQTKQEREMTEPK